MSVIIKFGRKQQKHKSFASVLKVPVYDRISRIEWVNDIGEKLPSRLPSNLKTLICNGKNIRILPQLPSSMTRLECNNNQIIELPELPTTLKVLDVGCNKISRLPNLSRLTKLKELYCGGNELRFLPKLPDSLKHLACELNNIYLLPKNMPSKLMILNIYGNHVRELPLSILDCDMFTQTKLLRDYPQYEIGVFYEEPLAIDENPVYDVLDECDFNLETYFNTLRRNEKKSQKRKRNDADTENKKIKTEQ